MKVQCEPWGQIEIPKSLEKRFNTYCKKHNIEPAKERGDWGFLEWVTEEEAPRLEGKIIPKEEAEFLAQYLGNLGFDGGYPLYNEHEFSDGDKSYTVCIGSCTSGIDNSNEDTVFAVFVYKNK